MPQTTTRSVPAQAVDLIKRFESLHDGDLRAIGCQPKMDPLRIWTAGYGRALRDPHTGQFLQGPEDRDEAYALCGGGITEVQAEAWLAEDLEEFAQGVSKRVKVPLADIQFGALVSFAYNVGLGNFGGSTLLKKLNAGDYVGASDEFPKWNRGGGKILPGLVKRREAEQRLFLCAK